jgi:ferredoxin-NADP reductase
VADDVVQLKLRTPAGELLPRWAPGAHIDLVLPGGLTRQYSLCGDPNERDTYTVAVLREEQGRGGSRYIHDELREQDELLIRGPRNHFGLNASDKYIFVAGGIGITPILPMMVAAEAAGADWHLYYGGRRRQSMAFLPALHRWRGSRVRIYPQDEVGLIDVENIVAAAHSEPRTQLYCCGPPPLLTAVREAAGSSLPSRLHMELFQPPDLDSNSSSPFDVELARSGVQLHIPAGTSVLHAMLVAGVDVEYSCESGTCGTCEIAVLAGAVEHRDTILTAEERRANSTMYVCVSRAASSRLVLDA